MTSAAKQINQLARVADAKMPSASGAFAQTRIVADLSLGGVMTVAVLLDHLAERVEQLEGHITGVHQKKKKKDRTK